VEINLDALTLEDVRNRDGFKWSTVGPDVIPAFIADMDFPVADAIREAVARRAATDLGYPPWVDDPSAGPLAEAFAERMETKYGWRPDPGHVRAFTDVDHAVQVLLHIATRPGDAVALHVPAYHPFLHMITSMERRLVPIPIGDDGRFEPPDEPASVLLLVNPQNPSGRVFTRAELEALAAYAERHDVLVISDEIHSDLVYAPARHIPFATLLPERTITLTSASKAFNMGGIRCAVAHVGARWVREALAREPVHLYGAVGALAVEATVAAWRHGEAWLSEVLRILDRNRRLIADLLPEWAGYRMPEGTYLAWLDLKIDDAAGFLERTARVRLSPGPDFGGRPGQARLNFATSRPILTEMLTRISEALRHAA